LVLGGCAYASTSLVACARAGAQFSLVLPQNTAMAAAITATPETAWTVRYTGAMIDPDTGGWISDAEVAETTYGFHIQPPSSDRAADRAAG
jgi:hypothetical protein